MHFDTFGTVWCRLKLLWLAWWKHNNWKFPALKSCNYPLLVWFLTNLGWMISPLIILWHKKYTGGMSFICWNQTEILFLQHMRLPVIAYLFFVCVVYTAVAFIITKFKTTGTQFIPTVYTERAHNWDRPAASLWCCGSPWRWSDQSLVWMCSWLTASSSGCSSAQHYWTWQTGCSLDCPGLLGWQWLCSWLDGRKDLNVSILYLKHELSWPF